MPTLTGKKNTLKIQAKLYKSAAFHSTHNVCFCGDIIKTLPYFGSRLTQQNYSGEGGEGVGEEGCGVGAWVDGKHYVFVRVGGLVVFVSCGWQGFIKV